jgi:hypothetical protein
MLSRATPARLASVLTASSLLACGGTGASARGISYATVPARWPENPVCMNKNHGPIVAKEVILGKSMTVVISGGEKAISDEAWKDFSPGLFNTKNSERHTMFALSCFVRSPGVPATCGAGTDPACRETVDLGGYSWIALSKIEAVDCFPASRTCNPANVKSGQLAFVVTRKCHELVFEGRAFILHGPHGEAAIMHATANGTPTTDVPLPDGWTLTEETLPEPLIVRPFGGGDACYFNILRDAKVQSYHQFRYAGPSYP